MCDTDMLLDGPGGSSATTLESDESNSLIISRMKALEVANRHQHQKDMPLPLFFGWLLTRSILALYSPHIARGTGAQQLIRTI